MKQPTETAMSDMEIAHRRDAAIRRALTTPARSQKKEAKPQGAKGEAQRLRRERERREKTD